MIAGVLCAALALSAAAEMVACVLVPRPLYFMLGFEVVALVAAVFGVLLAMGRFAQGPGLGLLCVAAAIGVGSLLGETSTYDPTSAHPANPLSGPMLRTLHLGGVIEVPITFFLLLRAAASGVVAL